MTTAEELDQAMEVACGSARYADLVLAINLYQRLPSAMTAARIGYLLLDCLREFRGEKVPPTG